MIITTLLTFAALSPPFRPAPRTLEEFTKPSFEAKCDLIHLEGQNGSIMIKVDSGQPYPINGAIDANKKYSFSDIKMTKTNVVINDDPFNMFPSKIVKNYRARDDSFEITLDANDPKKISNKNDEFNDQRDVAFFKTLDEEKWLISITGPRRKDVISVGFCLVTIEKQKLLTNAQLEEIRKK